MTGYRRPPGSFRAPKRTDLTAVRQAYAGKLMALAGAADPRLRKAFATVKREDFLPPPPWKIIAGGMIVDTAGDDMSSLYQNVLVSLKPGSGINNGEPSLHAAWLAAVNPLPGETVCHAGAGTGYYTAILAELVKPGGRVEAFEIEPDLAEQAKENLARNRQVAVRAGDATVTPLPACDVIYVNAGLSTPPTQWLDALNPGGRLIFPWRPTPDVASALLVSRIGNGFAVRPMASVWFIPITGAAAHETAVKLPDRASAKRIRSLWRMSERLPDESAVAIYENIWFSTRELD